MSHIGKRRTCFSLSSQCSMDSAAGAPGCWHLSRNFRPQRVPFSVIPKLREDEALAPGRRAHSQALLRASVLPPFFLEANQKRIRPPAPPRSLTSAPSASSALSSVSWFSSQRLCVSAVNSAVRKLPRSIKADAVGAVLLTAIIFASRDNFPTSAISVSLRQHTPQRSLPPPRSPGLTLICFLCASASLR